MKETNEHTHRVLVPLVFMYIYFLGYAYFAKIVFAIPGVCDDEPAFLNSIEPRGRHWKLLLRVSEFRVLGFRTGRV